MKKRMSALLFLLLALTGCVMRAASESGPPEGSYQVYFPISNDERGADKASDGRGAAVASETWLPSEGTEVVSALVKRLLAGPEGTELTSPFPKGVRLRRWEQQETQLHLDFSEQYEGLSGVDLSLANYCLALTLCQIEGVESVYITVKGEESPFLRGENLRAEDVVLSGAEDEPSSVNVTLWFPQADEKGLGVEYRQLLLTEEDTVSEAVLSALIKGPSYESLRAVIPPETEVRSITLEESVCHLNLSQSFLEGLSSDPVELRLRVYSIVNTLVGNVEAVKTVQIQVEGQSSVLPMDLAGQLSPDLMLDG